MAKTSRKRWWIVVLAIAGVLLVSGAAYVSVCMTLIQQDHIRDKYTLTETDNRFLWVALKASLLGRSFDATEAQVNTYLYKTFCGEDRPLKNVRVYFHHQEPCEIYARIHYHNRDLALSTQVETTFDSVEGVVGLRFPSVKLGEWNVPSWRVRTIMQEMANKYDLLTFSDDVLYVRTHYEYDFGDFGFHLRLEEFAPQEGTLRCRTNSLSREMLIALKDYLLSDRGQALFAQLFGEGTNALKNLILERLFR